MKVFYKLTKKSLIKVVFEQWSETRYRKPRRDSGAKWVKYFEIKYTI